MRKRTGDVLVGMILFKTLSEHARERVTLVGDVHLDHGRSRETWITSADKLIVSDFFF